jgi:hypothetical protein
MIIKKIVIFNRTENHKNYIRAKPCVRENRKMKIKQIPKFNKM